MREARRSCACSRIQRCGVRNAHRSHAIATGERFRATARSELECARESRQSMIDASVAIVEHTVRSPDIVSHRLATCDSRSAESDRADVPAGTPRPRRPQSCVHVRDRWLGRSRGNASQARELEQRLLGDLRSPRPDLRHDLSDDRGRARRVRRTTDARTRWAGAMGPHCAELGVEPLARARVILFGAEAAGRTTSPSLPCCCSTWCCGCGYRACSARSQLPHISCCASSEPLSASNLPCVIAP